MRASTTFVLSLLSLSTAVHAQPPRQAGRRHHARAAHEVIARAGAPISNATLQSISAYEAAEHNAASQTPLLDTSSTSSTSSTQTSSTSSTSSTDVATSSTPKSSSSSSDGDVLNNIGVSVNAGLGDSSSATPTSSTPLVLTPSSSSSTDSSTSSAVQTVTRISAPPVSVKHVTSTSAEPSTTALQDNTSSDKIGGLPKTTFIIIIAVASSVVLIALLWTGFRKWKLRPSNRFDSRMKPVDFSPAQDGMGEDFLEKTLKRSPSHSSLDRQRQMFVAELDQASPEYVEGVPDHDFTAGMSPQGYNDMYNADPYAHAQAYEYDMNDYYNSAHQYPSQHQYSSQDQQYGTSDYPTQDGPVHPTEDYADLHRGNSGSSHGSHGSGNSGRMIAPSDFPMPNQYLGRPTEGDGPYAQAQYGRY